MSGQREAYWARMRAEQDREDGERKRRNGPAARDLAAYLRERQPATASDYEDAVEQWLRDNGGIPQ